MKNNIDYDGGLTLSLPVSDLERSIAWYQDVLGFKLLYKLEELGWAELETGVQRVNIGLSVTEEVNAGSTTPTFGVTDIEAARGTLQALDVKLDGDINTIPGMVRLQTFYDRDGNALMFYQDLSRNG
jgi:catechol 2,3-dioxygenase-like lactoylglutathione lyase family enzyme